MCIKTLSEIANTVGVAIVLTVIALATIEHAKAAEENCEYAIDNLTDPRSGNTLLLTKSHFLQTPIDINTSHAALPAGRLISQDAPTERRYLRVSFVLVEFVETEDEAKSRRGLTKIAENMPLVIRLTDGSTMMLPSWGKAGRRNSGLIHRPSELGNSSNFFRVSHAAGGSYWPDDDQLAVLLEQPATMLQVTTTQGDFSVTIHPSRIDRIQYALGCI
jgi:hypothetical protein